MGEIFFEDTLFKGLERKSVEPKSFIVAAKSAAAL